LSNGFPKLKELDLIDCDNITDAGVNVLRQSRLTIRRGVRRNSTSDNYGWILMTRDR